AAIPCVSSGIRNSLASLLFTGPVLARIAGANESVRTLLDRVREFLQVLRNAAKIIKNLVNILRVHVDGLIQSAGNVRQRPQGFAKIDHRLAHIVAVFPEDFIDVREGLVSFRGSLDRKSTRLNSSHEWTAYAVFCVKRKRLRNTRCRTCGGCWGRCCSQCTARAAN